MSNNPYIQLIKDLTFQAALQNDLKAAKELLGKEEVGIHVINQWRSTFIGISLKEAKALYDLASNPIEVTIYEYVNSRFTWKSGEVILNKERKTATTREEVIETFPESVRVIFEVK